MRTADVPAQTSNAGACPGQLHNVCGGAQSWPQSRTLHNQPITEVKINSRSPGPVAGTCLARQLTYTDCKRVFGCRSAHCCAALPPSGVRPIHLSLTPLARRTCYLHATHSNAMAEAAPSAATDGESSTCGASSDDVAIAGMTRHKWCRVLTYSS